MGAPVILCGKTEKIGTGVIPAGASQIPATLRGDSNPQSDSQLGSKDYSTPPVAVILGGGYGDADIDLLFMAAREYGKALVVRIKALLAQMKKDGKMGEGKVVWY
ncbi:hypothetical protein B0H66DRAFT_582622 [Apodospora peruviana]|uniref:Uncharacterized protein n=1 Tax=Apodospora peruviana TaxID=516989 RepID=A0AAE0I708_9PEZI|nr:hypothetical protein B0H66DRAFT_582622 [Apodospora peruviana]